MPTAPPAPSPAPGTAETGTLPGIEPGPAPGDARRVTPPIGGAGGESGLALIQPGAEPAEPAPAVGESEDVPLWRRNAVPFEAAPDQPLLSVIIDNAGSGGITPAMLGAITAPVTLGVVPDGSAASEAMAAAAKAAGFEVLVEIPMEPRGPVDPGPEAIYVRMSDEEAAAQTLRLVERLGGAVGAMNQMGSRATEDRRVMDAVMDGVAGSGLAFIDSRTSVGSVADVAAEAAGVPFLRNSRFIAEGATAAEVFDALEFAARDAGRSGAAVVIGPPTEAMLQGLLRWGIEQNGQAARLAPVSAALIRLSAEN